MRYLAAMYLTGLETEIRERLFAESRACARAGSPMYASLLELAAKEAEPGRPLFEILRGACCAGVGPMGARLLAGLHELVLGGEAPELASFYPSVHGDWQRPGLREVFRDTCTIFSTRLGGWVNRPIQANEPGRSAAMLAGFHRAHSATRLPLRILELGASAGLNLFWDRFFYTGRGWSWGAEKSPVRLTKHFESGAPILSDDFIEVIERLGCDKQPMDCRLTSDLIRMKAFIWADQASYRFKLLETAWNLVAAENLSVEQADARVWILSRPLLLAGAVTVVFHSIFWDYLTGPDQDAIRETINEVGKSATASAPLAWLRLEPIGSKRTPCVRLTLWPPGRDEVLAHCKFDGSGIRFECCRRESTLNLPACDRAAGRFCD